MFLLGLLGFIAGILWCYIGAGEMSNRKSKRYIVCLFMAIAWMCLSMVFWCEQITINYGF
jgi:hypothetical protein